MDRAFAYLLACISLAFSPAAFAHLTPNSEVTLSFEKGGISADIVVPAAEYSFASGNEASNESASLRAAQRYLLNRVQVYGPDASRWSAELSQLRFATVSGPEDLLARIRFVAPEDSAAGPVNLHWTVVTAEQPDHFALVNLREGSVTRTIGAVRQASSTIVVERQSSSLSAMANAARLGAIHIISGYDHLLFLMALLLVAPFVAVDGRWAKRRGSRETAIRLLRIVTGFTVGHSVTLIGAGLGNWQLPSAPVELAIAGSVVLTALHAVRPIFPGRETLVAFSFGLIHGLAFATLLAEADLQVSRNLATLAGFNLGIEAVQLAILTVIVPLYIVSMRLPRSPLIRPALGAVIALCGVYWIADRAPLLL
ncbi:HupE/UreJ family protein [Croceicoccus naphthovorans]|uniref:HupE/UreJ family protein n=1 Tax=Croceicoccus naphthovorans TaxID=1348774 RepID=UPI00069E6F6B|nr:HupE/UreJ family protein [Croceicoccus naphthovorans]MBB3992215.1 hypothetical protein [Croceicoccus naphthovorans]